MRGRSTSWEGKSGLKRTTEVEVLGIKYRIDNMESITDDNITVKISDIKKLIAIWNTTTLTPYGKVVITKSLLISKITHILLSLPTPSDMAPSQLDQLQVNLDMTDSMGPGKLVRHMQNPSYTYDEYLICIVLGPSISSVICKNPSYSGPSYPSSPVFYTFLLGNKPPKFHREIVETNTIDGSLKFHNLRKFDAALQIGWLKRYITTESKWKILPQTFEFSGLFRFGVDYIGRIHEVTFHPFWQDVLTRLKTLCKDDKISIPENILLTPLWYNDNFRLQIKKDWIAKGVYTLWDLLEPKSKPMSLENFESKYKLKSNFLEYGTFSKIIRDFLEWKEKPYFNYVDPTNCMLNIILQKDT